METSLAHMTKVNRTQRYECGRARFLSIKMGNYVSVWLCLSQYKERKRQNEAECTTFLVKMSFISTRTKNRSYIKG